MIILQIALGIILAPVILALLYTAFVWIFSFFLALILTWDAPPDEKKTKINSIDLDTKLSQNSNVKVNKSENLEKTEPILFLIAIALFLSVSIAIYDVIYKK